MPPVPAVLYRWAMHASAASEQKAETHDQQVAGRGGEMGDRVLRVVAGINAG